MEGNVFRAAKWSTVTEILARLAAPVTNAILARLLMPEAFGLAATIMVVISFAEVFTDAGFQKYLVQREFKDTQDMSESTNVAFWTNMGLSLSLWGIFVLFRNQIAFITGAPALGKAIAVAGVSIPLIGLSSIQAALFRRRFDFKTLFFIRLVSVCIPFVVTIPAAVYFRNYWALVIGTICVYAFTALLLTIRSPWKPKLCYSVSKLREMLSFCVWTLLEQIVIWIGSNAGILIVAKVLNEYYLGLYKISISTVTSLLSVVTASSMPILFSSLSRLQNDHEQYWKMFFGFQKSIALIIFPMCTGLFLFRNLATSILLGEQWLITADFIGLLSVSNCISVVFSYPISEVYRSSGRPKMSLLAQSIYLALGIPTLLYGATQGYQMLCVATAITSIFLVVINQILLRILYGISVSRTMRNILPSLVATAIMGSAGLLLQQVSNGVLWSFASIGICVLIYASVVLIIPSTRNDLKRIWQLKVSMAAQNSSPNDAQYD